jgi:DNA-binding LacI/PurR family transcriptional regulator
LEKTAILKIADLFKKIYFDIMALGSLRVKMLMDMIKVGQDNNRHILLEPELILRTSTR